MVDPPIGNSRLARLAVVLVSASAMVFAGFWNGPVSADVSEVEGSAYGYFASVSLFGGPPNVRGPAPTVTLPPGGGLETATAPSGSAQFGPATIFSSGPLTVTTEGTTGPAGSVTSTADVQNVNASGQEVFTAANVTSTCTASETGTIGSTTIVGGTLQTSEGDPNVEGDETVVTIPTNPAPNTTYTGQIETVGDNFRYVFNEQIVNPDGSLTVNAAHLYLLGPTAVGDLIIGQVECGATIVASSTTTTEAETTSTTEEPTTSTTEAETTTTTEAETTTTTEAETTTTTTEAPGNMPTAKAQCKKGGYEDFGFRNQGQCVSFVASEGRSGGPA